MNCNTYWQDGSAAIRVKKDDSPWGASDFAPADKGGQSTGAYNWGSEAPQGDFFSDMLSNPKQVRSPVSNVSYLSYFVLQRVNA